MGQHVSTVGVETDRARERNATAVALPYTPLIDTVKIGDPSSTVSATADDTKDALTKILEFGASLRYLPKDGGAGRPSPLLSTEQQLHGILSSVDSAEELFQYISSLTSGYSEQSPSGRVDAASLDRSRELATAPGGFDVRVSSYVRSLQQLYHLTKKERQRYEQRLQAARTQATAQRKISPPPLPLPTQNCIAMGWELAVHLLGATRANNPAQYLQALEIIKSNLLSLKPTAYSDSMYLAPSASTSFDELSDCLTALTEPTDGNTCDMENKLCSTTIETLAEVALARGSLATLLSVVLWLIKQPPNLSVDLGVTLTKLAALKEQPLYGKCEASGELYCCGQNSYGELGIGDDIERHLLTSVSLCGWDDIRQVVSGNEMLAILTNGGVVLTCGLNKSGQCGQGHFDERVMLLRPVQALRSQKIKLIAASNGCEHLIVLTETGLAYSWGYNDRGQLGHENSTTKIHLPKLIESMKDKKINFAAVSYHHSALVTEAGELYTFGMNDCGQLGLDHTQHTPTPQLVKLLSRHEVSMVGCGLYHTVVCTAAGELFTFGKNDYGQLGLGHSRQIKAPAQVLLSNEMVCFVACGYYHSMVVTTTGHTYAFGRNDYGQLGIGSKIHQNTPTLVALSANTRMIRATCGCYHTVLLSEQGQVFVFGRNNKGQLGNRSSADSLLPVPLKVRPEKNSRRCIDVAAGFYTTSLIFERKRENDDGETIMLDQSCLVSVCGRVDIDRSGEIEGLSNFGSISTTGVALVSGKWFYEVEVVTSGLIQIGWIDSYFQGSSDQGEGVGDHTHSWSYDGNRQRRWNSGSSSYGEKWKAGDVIGCLLDLEAKEMAFYRNGIPLGTAFTNLKCSANDRRSGLMPGISLERGEIIRVNVGHQPFAYPPTSVVDSEAVLKSISYPATAATMRSITNDMLDFGPIALEGSASVQVENRLFVIGGSVVSNGAPPDPTNQVWVYHLDAQRWEKWTDFPIGIRFHQAVVLDDDHILVLGGERVSSTSRHMDLYKCSISKGLDGSLPAWELVHCTVAATTALPAARAHHVAVTIRARLDGMVFMYGGKSAEDEILGDVWFLSLDDFSWSRQPNSLSLDPGPRSGCSSTVIGECVYLFGGADREEKFRSDLWRYNAFDRIWHLCHDDQIIIAHDNGNGEAANDLSRTDFNPLLPEPRAHYSIVGDLGNIWVFGGARQTGQLLNDLWCYSTTNQKWSSVAFTTEDGVDGACSGSLVVIDGTATALAFASESGSNPTVRPGRLALFGGRVEVNGVVHATSAIREITATDSSRNFVADPTRSISTSGKSTAILGMLRAKCTIGAGKTTQQCLAEALDSGICVLSNLDRLAGNDIPCDETEAIQLSRCAYRTLCVDPKPETFEALHSLLITLTGELLKINCFDENESEGSAISRVFYPLLVTIRLLKLNFFELSRLCLNPDEVGLESTTVRPAGILHSVREILFQIAEHSPQMIPSSELEWYCRAVKHETAAAIYHGFSTLFPSLLERVDVMNKLMQDTSCGDRNASPTKKLLIPMLLPCFTSSKMLFQLMEGAPSLFGFDADKNLNVQNVITGFADTLLETLWNQTKNIIASADIADSMSMKRLSELDVSPEFKCLNVLLRACMYWCSYSTKTGWSIMNPINSKLVSYFGQLLGMGASMLPSEVSAVPILIQQTFPGKLLPFVLIGIGSLPNVREEFTDLFSGFWPCLEDLLNRIHTVLAHIEANGRSKVQITSRFQVAPKPESSTSLSGQFAHVSNELRSVLSLSDSQRVSHDEVQNLLWNKMVAAESFRAKKMRTESAGVEMYRVFVPSDISRLFCTVSFLISVNNVTVNDSVALKKVDSANISFKPSRMLLSQHLWMEEFGTTSTGDSGLSPPAPVALPKSTNSKPVASFVNNNEDYLNWLKDIQRILTWLGSHYAASLVIGTGATISEKLDRRWITSPLFRGGLPSNTQDASITLTASLGTVSDACARNRLLLEQIISNIGAGKKLLEKVKHALDPGSTTGTANPKLLVTRLKRQDSVEAALEKSGGIEIVDKAVRVTFAVLLRHSNCAYLNEALTRDGIPSEAVIDTWRSALQLRRWIVREQQKLASESGLVDMYQPNATAKERQHALYASVCDPVIQRGELLVQLFPVSLLDNTDTNWFVLLPGTSKLTTYDLTKCAAEERLGDIESCEQVVRQVRCLSEAKTAEMIEEEDEKIQADVFAFLQQSLKAKHINDDPDAPTQLGVDEIIKLMLSAHTQRATDRLEGLRTFMRLFRLAEMNPSCRWDIIPSFSVSFKRISRNNIEDGVNRTSPQFVKVHYLENLEFAGIQLCTSIRTEFFALLSTLLTMAQSHIYQVKQGFESRTSSQNKPSILTSTTALQRAIHEVTLIFEACSIPYQDDDWDEIIKIKFLSLLTDLTCWKSWKDTLQLEVADDPRSLLSRGDTYPILSVGISQKYPKIICQRSITIGTDLHQLTLAHRRQNSSAQASGGLAVYDNPMYRGRWYWELCITVQNDQPIFVGISSRSNDLNYVTRSCHNGIFLFSNEEGNSEAFGGLRVRVGETVGVLLDCEEKKLEFYVGDNQIGAVTLDIKDLIVHGIYAAVGILDAELYWNLDAVVPETIWDSSHRGFEFPSPVVSGCLIASPLNGAYIGWNAKCRGRQLRLSPDAVAITAGDGCGSTRDDQFETILANHAFTSESIFVEVHILAPGRHGRCDLSFGMVDSDYNEFDAGLEDAIYVRRNWPEDSLEWGVFGVLFDFGNGKVTVYPGVGDPYSSVVKTSSSKVPLIPAISVLCNGTTFSVNFHPRSRPDLPLAVIRPAGTSVNSNITSTNDIQIGKILQMLVHTCDGGEFSASHAARNCLLDDSSVFSSAKGTNVNLVLRHEPDTPFCLSYVSLRGPGPGYSSPVRHAIIFVTSSVPDLRRLDAYNNLTPEAFACIPFPVPSHRSDRDEWMPVAFFVLDGSCAHIAKQLAVPVSGRYVVVKLICPSSGNNIDIGHIGLCGAFDKSNGPAYAENCELAACCEECRVNILHGVYYSLKGDDSIKLCAACYDDNRGNLAESFFAHVGIDSEGQNDDGAVLCLPRRTWHQKMPAQFGSIPKRFNSNSVKDIPGSEIPIGNAPTGGPVLPHDGAMEKSSTWFEDCELFSCGQNNYGELCLGHCNSTSKLEHVPFFSAKNVRDLAGGNEVLAVLLKDGTLYTCGLNKSGQCGNGTFDERILVATPVRALSGIPIDVVAAANGCEHMLAVASNGFVYAWGYNDRGQLGLGSTISKSHTPRLIDSLRDKYTITAAAVSYHHSAVVSSSGALLMFGMNDCGQLGLDHTQHQLTPQLVDSLSSQVIVKVACGLYHTVAITAGGDLYAFGKNDYGQLGLGHARNVKVPTRVRTCMGGDHDEKIVGVSCGYYHTIAITDKGKLMTWGRNDYGQLGIGSKDHKNAPQYVPLPLSSRISKASCGCYHSLILMSNGRVMVFGRNNKGQLGAGARTLPSADLPLPIPSNSLANDEVVCLAAGFYSSYILTGRSSESRDPERDMDAAAAQAKDLPEHSTTAEALYENLMNEMDRNPLSTLVADKASVASKVHVKRGSNVQHKLPLVKLHAAAWALVRALLYQLLKTANVYPPSLTVATTTVTSEGSVQSQHEARRHKKRHGALCVLIEFLLGNLNQMQAELGHNVESALQSVGMTRLDTCATIKNACVGLLTYCVACGHPMQHLNDVNEPTLSALYPHFFRNQILLVLLSCGSVNSKACALVAHNTNVLSEVLKGLTSSDLTSSIICIRLAMLVFPLHSMESVSAAYRQTLGSGGTGVDIVNLLMLLVGSPLVVRPRLCAHELGLERNCSLLCEASNCAKGIVDQESTVRVHDDMLEKSHLATARAAEVVTLLRYLTLSPTWRMAVNSKVNRALACADKIGELLDTVCTYYTSWQSSDSSTADLASGTTRVGTVNMENGTFQMNDEATDAVDTDPVDVREPETTATGPSSSQTACVSPSSGVSPEIDDSIGSFTSESATKDASETTMLQDKKALLVWQRAKDALDDLARVLAAVSVVGGHVECMREGALAVVDDADHKWCGQTGVLSGIKKDPRGDVLVSLTLMPRETDSTFACLVPPVTETDTTTDVLVKNLRVIERVAPVLSMFDGIGDIITSLSVLVLPSSLDDGAAHVDLEHPQNHGVQEMLGYRMRSYKKQLQWRATKALGSLLKQMPLLKPEQIKTDTQLLSNIAHSIASENTDRNSNALLSMRTMDRLESTTVATMVDGLHNRWLVVKQRQTLLEAEHVVDKTLDHAESASRNAAVTKLGQENALSWGIDAIQSPRKIGMNGQSSSFVLGNGTNRASLTLSATPGRGNRSDFGRRSSVNGDLPQGAWGVLHPLPQLNERDGGDAGSAAAAAAVANAIDFSPFHLTSAIIRVGRAVDSCDLVVNDRSVSGRHFHLRRVHRDGDDGEDLFELQDFSKNGTIVNGVRVHGTSVRITPGSRISLILSRGGLVTYEFQVRSSVTDSVVRQGNPQSAAHPPSTGSTRTPPPPPIITTPHITQHRDNAAAFFGQEYQQPPSNSTGQSNGAPMPIPRSPAELQNRGGRQSMATPTSSTSVGGGSGLRSRVPAVQGLRLITSVAESDVPRALISPNPAVESPRVGGYNSPRSSVLQAPGTPSVGSPTSGMYNSGMIPVGIMSPASFQQHESSAMNDTQSLLAPLPATLRSPETALGGDALRIALGRGSLNREGTANRGGTTRSKPFSFDMMGDGDDENSTTLQPIGMNSNIVAAVRASNAVQFQETERVGSICHSPHVVHLANLLGKNTAVCAEALRQTQHNVAAAMRLLLSPAGNELEVALSQIGLGVQNTINPSDASPMLQPVTTDAVSTLHDAMDENESYALSESSARQYAPPRARLASPMKLKKPVDGGSAAKSQLRLWTQALASVDDRIQLMNSAEIDDEETSMCDVLTAVHSRKLLQQIIRLFGNVPSQADNLLAAFGDPVTLRHLIRFPPNTAAAIDIKNNLDHRLPTDSGDTHMADLSDGGMVQRILARTAVECFQAYPSNTMRDNLQAVQSLSTLVGAIDERETWSSNASRLALLLKTLLKYESQAVADDGSGLLHQTSIIHNLMVDTLLHTLSRTYVHHSAPLLSWEAAVSLFKRPIEAVLPKGPIRLSCGIECVVVSTYDRVWSVPSPDPLLQYRHQWRKRANPSSGSGVRGEREREPWAKSMTEHYVTLWRPALSDGIHISASGESSSSNSANTWFRLGDVMRIGCDTPSEPAILIHDDGSGRLMPPIDFERVDISGKGLPQNSDNDPEFQRKQIRSLWWPVAPPGYVTVGCIAGSKEDPFERPPLDTVRCVREDLVQRVDSYTCRWRAEVHPATPCIRKCVDPIDSDKRSEQQQQHHQNSEGPTSGNMGKDTDNALVCLESPLAKAWVRTSLWSIETDFCPGILPVISVDEDCSRIASTSIITTAFTVSLTLEDKITLAPVTVSSIMNFIHVLLKCQQFTLASPVLTAIRPELAAAIFALLKQILFEKLPSTGQTAIQLVRALISLIQNGCEWKDRQGVLYCRSKIMTLQQQEQDNASGNSGLMLSGLLQALVELMLVVEEQDREARVDELVACLNKNTNATIDLPYRFQFISATYNSQQEILVSHSSKIAVTRHVVGEDRKFQVEHLASDRDPSDVMPSNAPTVEHASCRFEHMPALAVTLKGDIKATIKYFEATVLEWREQSSSSGETDATDASTASIRVGQLALGFSPPAFPLEGSAVGLNTSGAKTYSFTPTSGKVQSPDTDADHWTWRESVNGIVAIGDTYGCGLRMDSNEIFFTKNGVLLGTAFSSVGAAVHLNPTISVCSADCKLMVNVGASSTNDGTGISMNTPISASQLNFAFRFHALDYDNVMSGFEWYEQLSQVYGVMQTLMTRNRVQNEKQVAGMNRPAKKTLLPDEFMLSADNFLSEISEDVCIRVTSAHPYDLELQESLVHIPLATSIRVKLDGRCETANSHCLQILQGGGENAESNECEIRAFTGACGGQEVMIDGDSFVWRFPVQSNFQCRVDRVRKGPYLKLENRDTRLSLSRDKGWQTAIGVARFENGVQVWEVRINFVTASSNIFLGIGRRDVRLDSYLGKDNRGWGWIGNRALWHNGSKQRGTYGEKFKTGDIVRMTLDLKKGTLSYALNGKDLGVAFGPGGVGPKLEGTFYPGFALYNQRDSIDLIGGHRVEDGDGSHANGGGVGLAPNGEESYYSEDEDDSMLESAVDTDVDESIPNFRMEMATTLSQMGFSMDWCVYALRHCEDDGEQAVDYILANMHLLEGLVREEREFMARRRAHRSSLATNTGVSPLTGDSLNDETGMIDGGADSALSSTAGEAAGAPVSPAANPEKWGISFTAVPEFSVTGRRLLAVKYASQLRYLHDSQAVFNHELDCAIVQVVNEICEARAEALLSCDPLRMAPDEFVITEEHLRRLPCLQALSLAQIQKRFLILRNFNCRLQNSLAFVDLSAQDTHSVLARGARSLRGIIFQHVKLAWWLNILKDQQAPAAARPEIEVDRHRARDATELTGVKDSVFAQCLDQLQELQPSLLRGADRAFKCQFVGEFGDDFGGLYRECLAQISSELQSNVLPILRPCPNAVNLVGEYREAYVPNPHLGSEVRLVQMAEFLGKLIGIAIRTKTPLDLNLPPVFWKTIVRESVTRKDIEAIHQGCFQVVDSIDNVNRHGITESMFDEIIDTHFSVQSSSQRLVELVPGGRHVRVLWEDKESFVRSVEAYRLTEFSPVCADIMRGIATMLPMPTIALFTWKEFSTLVCGKPTVDVDLLRRRTIYGDGCQATDPHIAFFWEVLNEFTDEQKSSFLRFVWGRSRLPTHAADFTQDFKISGLPKSAARPDAYLPIAHTCFFSIDLPFYSSREVMQAKLLYAITNCQSIDADNTTVAQRAGQGLNWTATTTPTAGSIVNATSASAAVATAAAAVSNVLAGLSMSLAE